MDRNTYGNSRLNSLIEMTSLLPVYSNRLNAIRHYVWHSEGEGAFGKVYKGELTQTNGEKTFVAVKALKENASVRTLADLKREIEFISDLKHANIICIL